MSDTFDFTMLTNNDPALKDAMVTIAVSAVEKQMADQPANVKVILTDASK